MVTNITEYMRETYKTLTLLCVEDDAEVLAIYENLFSVMFAKVYVAKDGEEALEIYKNNAIDIILTDYKMPKLNGLDLSKRVREDNPHIPIIMVTALENIGMLREAFELNITGFLKKPITADSLSKTFAIALKLIIAQRIIDQEEQKAQLQRGES